MSEAPQADVIDVWQPRPGLWRWRFRAGGNHTEIVSNETYRTLEQALWSARVAYPGVPVAGMERRRDPVAVYAVVAFVGVLAVGALVRWLLRRWARRSR